MRCWGSLATGFVLLAFVAPAGRGDTALTTVQVASGLTRPVFVTAPPGDAHRIFIVEQRSGNVGRVRIVNLDTGVLYATPFLSVSGVSTGSEQGLLGLAFHPAYAENGYFYVNFTRADGDTVVRRYTVSADPDVADPNSAQTVLIVDQPYGNHNGGWLGFGPDGYLYVALGDGGDANDPQNRAQNVESLLGKMLRLDVDGDDFPADPNANYAIPPTNPFVGVVGRDEIWAYGLRNPWRNSFDRLTGDLWIADVGQSAREEIDFQPASSPGGENYGWRCMEGTLCTGLSGCTCNAPELIDPIYEYSHALGCSITGGYVYRGTAVCDLRGTYFFADYCAASIWTFRYEGGTVTDFRDRTEELDPNGPATINSITSFGEDARGELYVCDLGGEVYRIVAAAGPAKGDLNNDGAVDFGDINAFVLALTNAEAYRLLYGLEPSAAGDLDCDGGLNFGDINLFVALLAG